MKLSEIIIALAKTINENGDLYVSHFKITDEIETSERYMLSPDRKDRNGNRAKMNHKEFKKYVENQKNPKQGWEIENYL
jgi:hypothetical protein